MHMGAAGLASSHGTWQTPRKQGEEKQLTRKQRKMFAKEENGDCEQGTL
jgi:hypothetical protein